MNPNKRQHDAGEYIDALGAAAGTNRFTRTAHVIGVDGIADHLECEVGFHRGADVDVGIAEQRPAAVIALDAAQIDRDFGFKRSIDRLAEIMPQQHVFGGNGRVGLEFEHPMAVGTLLRQKRLRAFLDVLFKHVVERTCEALASCSSVSLSC